MLDRLFSLAVPALTIIGLVVLLAMGKIDQAAGLSLIAALAGGHIVAGATSNAAAQAAAQTQAAAQNNQPPAP